MKRSVMVPDAVWTWAQAKSGNVKPGNFIRELLYTAMIRDIENGVDIVPPEPESKSLDTRWAALGCEINGNFDPNFSVARKMYVEHQGEGDELATIEFLEKSVKQRGMNSPRAFIMKWYKDFCG